MASPQDLQLLRRALRLAAKGRWRASPNPQVGAVIVRGGEIVGEGWHHAVGGPHAEIEAFRDAGEKTRGATLYVSLEPCAHFGRTPPCADATIEAGIVRVVACTRDPNPKVAGGGFARLRAAGIEVEHGFHIEQAIRLNWKYFAAAVFKRPAVTLKWAMSLDGRIATAGGDSQWISSPRGRRWALELREEHDAVLVGSGTALADDPRLDRRLGLAGKPGVRVVLDRRLRLAPTALLFDAPGPILVYTSRASEGPRADALRQRGAEVVVLPEVVPDAVLADLYSRGLRSVLVEGGAEIAAAFSSEMLFDQVAALCAPLLIGGQEAKGPLGGAGFEPLAAAPRLTGMQVQRKGSDAVITAFKASCLPDLYASVAD